MTWLRGFRPRASVAGYRKFDYYRGCGTAANAYAQTGQLERADHLFAEVRRFPRLRTLYNYASFSEDGETAEEAPSGCRSFWREAHVAAVHARGGNGRVPERQGSVKELASA